MSDPEKKRYTIIHGGIITDVGGRNGRKGPGEVVELDPVEKALMDPQGDCLVETVLFEAQQKAKAAGDATLKAELKKAEDEDAAKKDAAKKDAAKKGGK